LVDALVSIGEEGRVNLRKASESRKRRRPGDIRMGKPDGDKDP